MKNLPKIALGAWAWGNDGTFGNSFTADQLRPIFDTAMKNGLNLWDTAFAYGMGTSEKMLAGFLKGLPRESYLISDKFTPQCADTTSQTAMQDMIEMQLGLMELDRFDVYWIHNVWGAPKWTEELAKYYEGKENVPIIGVSNHNLAEIKQADEILKAPAPREEPRRRDYRPEPPPQQPRRSDSGKVVNIHATTQLQVVLVKPERYDNASEIADHLRDKRTVVLNLEKTEKEVSRRLLDFLSGVAYAQEGKIKKVALQTYIVTPYNVDIMGDLIDELENNGLYF